MRISSRMGRSSISRKGGHIILKGEQPLIASPVTYCTTIDKQYQSPLLLPKGFFTDPETHLRLETEKIVTTNRPI
jgi:hypothetical protein